jgi:N-acetylmuramoyl-L-alanine amidase
VTELDCIDCRVSHPWRGSVAVRVESLFAAALIALSLTIPAVAQAPPAPSARFVVVLDAAHGGNDAGGTLASQDGNSQPEKAYTLALSVRLRSLLAARGIYVVTTRESDATIDNDTRSATANHANARACLSLHASESGSGIHLFVSSLPPTEPTRLNPWKTAQAAWITRSLALAGMVNSALTHAGLPVIDSMTCPAVAVEVAPEITSGNAQPTDVADTGYQTRVAEALAAAIVEWRSDSRAEGTLP